MYAPVFAKSFRNYERKGFGCCGLILCFILAFTFSSTFTPHLHPRSIIGDAFNLRLSTDALRDVLTANDTVKNSEPKVGKIICRAMKSSNADYCEIEGDIRIQANTSTIFVVTPQETTSNSTNSWIVTPYPRKNLPFVNHWKVKLVGDNDQDAKIPMCTQIQNRPAILFSMGGLVGNFFHDFADLLFPLYTTSIPFEREVQLLVSERVKPWWISKYRKILKRFTRHQIVDINEEKGQVYCYKEMIIGLKFYREFMVDQSASDYPTRVSMYNFRQLLRHTYSLKRKAVMKSRSPRLMIVSRSKTRIITNEDDISRAATRIGFEVVMAEARVSTNVTRFAQLVNSCDVMVGIHGAGLTNMLFLPDNAILIQLLPFGRIEGIARLDFGHPADEMNLRYLEYEVSVKESSLSQLYPVDHPVLKDPMSIHREGWDRIFKVYLKDQNVTVDVQRFEGTLVEAMKLLRS